MDAQVENSNLKREHDDDDGDNSDENKQMKLEAPENADNDELLPGTKLTDVNDNCLLHIFDHLVIRDLINLYDTCKRLQTPFESGGI